MMTAQREDASSPIILRQRVDVSVVVPATGGEAIVATTTIADPAFSGPRTVCFGFPGGGYTRAYFDLHHAQLDGPSQAEHHAANGIIFISCDPFGGGDSTPLDDSLIDVEATGIVFDELVREMVKQLRSGTLLDGLGPVDVERIVGMGHSLGGMQVIVQQARNATFDAVAILGWSSIHTAMPSKNGRLAPHHGAEGSLDDAWAGLMTDDEQPQRYGYHWEDVSPALVEEDTSVGFPTRTADILPEWISATFPPFAKICLTPGIVAEEAAAITVPVFIGAGERDTTEDVRNEPSAYRMATDISVAEIPRMAHMHNFSPSRRALWQRIDRWLSTLPSPSD